MAQGRAWQQQYQVRNKVQDVEDPAWHTGQQRADQVGDQQEVMGVSVGVAQDSVSDHAGLAGHQRPLVQDPVRTVVTIELLARIGPVVGMVVLMWMVAMMVVMMGARLVIVVMIAACSNGVICI